MAKIPVITTEFRTSPGDPGAEFRADFTGPVASAEGLTRGLRALGAGIKARQDRDEAQRNQQQDFEVQRRFVEFQTEQMSQMREAWDGAEAGAFGLTSGVQANYETAAKEFFKTVPNRLKSQFDLKLANLAGNISLRTETHQSNVQEAYYGAEVKSGLEEIYNSVSDGTISYEDGILQGQELIDTAGLRELTKFELDNEWRERAAIAKWNREFALDPNAARIALGDATPAIRSDYQFDQLARSVEKFESGGDPFAESPVGASGLMQVMPPTARDIAMELNDGSFPIGGTDEDVKDWLKTGENSRRYGRYYLQKRLNQFDGDLEAALIAYNAGAERAKKWLENGRDWSVLPKGVQQETRPYVQNILRDLGITTTDGSPATFAATGPSNSIYLDIPFDEREKLLGRASREMSARLRLQQSVFNDAFDQNIQFMLDNAGEVSPDFTWNPDEVLSLYADDPVKAQNMIAEFEEAKRDGFYLSEVQSMTFDEIMQVIEEYDTLLTEPGRNIEENKSRSRYVKRALDFLSSTNTEFEALEGLVAARTAIMEGFEADGTMQALKGSEAVRTSFEEFNAANREGSEDAGVKQRVFLTTLEDYYDQQGVPFNQRYVLPHASSEGFVDALGQAAPEERALMLRQFLEPWSPQARERVIKGLDKAGLSQDYVVAAYKFNENPALSSTIAGLANTDIATITIGTNTSDFDDEYQPLLQDYANVYTTVGASRKEQAFKTFSQFYDVGRKYGMSLVQTGIDPIEAARIAAQDIFSEGVINYEDKKIFLPSARERPDLNTNRFRNEFEGALDRVLDTNVLEQLDLDPVTITGIEDIDRDVFIESVASTGTWVTQRDQWGEPIGAVLNYQVGTELVPVVDKQNRLIQVDFETVLDLDSITDVPLELLGIEGIPVEDIIKLLTR